MAAWWRGWLGEDPPEPPAILTKAEVAERVKAYAVANGHSSEEPFDIKLKRQARDPKDPQASDHYVYTMGLGIYIPGTIVVVDAVDGTVLEWRVLPR